MSDSQPPEPSADLPDSVIAGWYGKLPSLGDFATRRLSSAFIEPWDTWLCERMADTKSRLGERWLALYLTCPVWRFFLMPEVLAAGSGECWTGVLMASVDRVGRHFPLTIAAGLRSAPGTSDEIDGIWQWLSGIEAAALAALEFDYTIDQLDAQLARLPPPPVTSKPSDRQSAAINTAWSVSAASGLGPQLAKELTPRCQTALHGMSFWSALQNGADDRQIASTPPIFTIWRSGGLPDNDLFVDMLLNRQP